MNGFRSMAHAFASFLAAYGLVVSLPDTMKVPCTPVWVDESEFAAKDQTTTFLTHFCLRLDPNRLTKVGLDSLVTLSKEKQFGVIYLQEEHAPTSDYFYTDCGPTAYVGSSIGFFKFDSSEIRHAIVAGGFYEMCLNNTVTQIARNWQSINEPIDLRITYVTDAIYNVASDSRVGDRFDRKIRDWLNKQKHTTVVLSDVLDQLDDRTDALEFLSRRARLLPVGFGLNLKYEGDTHLLRQPATERPIITVEFLTASQLKTTLEHEESNPIMAPKLIEELSDSLSETSEQP